MPIKELLSEDHLLRQPDIARTLVNAVTLLKMFYQDWLSRATLGTADEDNQLKEVFANGIKISQLANARPALYEQDLKDSN
ncbi:MAG: hypothetical protein WDO19_24035 [Bacteroidota bacterium]